MSEETGRRQSGNGQKLLLIISYIRGDVHHHLMPNSLVLPLKQLIFLL